MVAATVTAILHAIYETRSFAATRLAIVCAKFPLVQSGRASKEGLIRANKKKQKQRATDGARTLQRRAPLELAAELRRVCIRLCHLTLSLQRQHHLHPSTNPTPSRSSAPSSSETQLCVLPHLTQLRLELGDADLAAAIVDVILRRVRAPAPRYLHLDISRAADLEVAFPIVTHTLRFCTDDPAKMPMSWAPLQALETFA